MLHFTPYCCWAYFYKGKYKTVILQLHYDPLVKGSSLFDNEIIKSLISFRKKFEGNKLNFSDVYKHQKTKMKDDYTAEKFDGDTNFKGDYYFEWECEPIKNKRYEEIVNEFGIRDEKQMEQIPIDWFFGIGSGRVYVEDGRWSTSEEGSRSILNYNALPTAVDNPNYRFKNFKNLDLFKNCILGMLTNSNYEDYRLHLYNRDLY
jgi:hypothetical protein